MGVYDNFNFPEQKRPVDRRLSLLFISLCKEPSSAANQKAGQRQQTTAKAAGQSPDTQADRGKTPKPKRNTALYSTGVYLAIGKEGELLILNPRLRTD